METMTISQLAGEMHGIPNLGDLNICLKNQ